MLKLYIYLYHSICILLLFPIAELFAEVFINQEGYLPDSPKYVFVSQAAESFSVKEASGNTVVFHSQAGLINAQMSWQNVKEIAHLTYLRGSQSGINSTVQGILRIALIDRCEALLNQRNNTGFHAAIFPAQTLQWELTFPV